MPYRRLLIVAILTIILPLTFILAHVATVSAATVGAGTAERHVILMIDNSKSMKNLDGVDRRIRFARFLFNYLRTFYPDVQLGAVSFGGNEVVPSVIELTSGQDWTQGDVRTIEEHPPGEVGTAFTRAFETAEAMLFPDCQNGEEGCVQADCKLPNQCELVLFSDGVFEDSGDSPQRLKPVLSRLTEQNVQTTAVLFYFKKEEVGADADWKDLTNHIIGFSTSSDADTGSLYRQVLQELDLRGALDAFDFALVKDGGSIPLAVPPYRQILQVMMLADNPLVEEWSSPPDITAGIERIWIEPPFASLTATVSTVATGTETLVFYAPVLTYTAPLYLHASVEPKDVDPGGSIEVQAWLQAGAYIITDTEGLKVSMSIPDHPDCILTPSKSGVFSCTVSFSDPDVYTATFAAKVAPSIQLSAPEVVTRSIVVDHVPGISLDIAADEAVDRGAVRVQVKVEHADRLPSGDEPVLYRDNEGIELSRREADLYVAEILLRRNEATRLTAEIPAGTTSTGRPYSKATETLMVYRRAEFVSLPQPSFDLLRIDVTRYPEALLGTLIFVLAAIIVTNGAMKKRHGLKPKAFRPGISLVLVSKTIDDLAGGPHSWPQVEVLSRHIKENYKERRTNGDIPTAPVPQTLDSEEEINAAVLYLAKKRSLDKQNQNAALAYITGILQAQLELSLETADPLDVFYGPEHYEIAQAYPGAFEAAAAKLTGDGANNAHELFFDIWNDIRSLTMYEGPIESNELTTEDTRLLLKDMRRRLQRLSQYSTSLEHKYRALSENQGSNTVEQAALHARRLTIVLRWLDHMAEKAADQLGSKDPLLNPYALVSNPELADVLEPDQWAMLLCLSQLEWQQDYCETFDRFACELPDAFEVGGGAFSSTESAVRHVGFTAWPYPDQIILSRILGLYYCRRYSPHAWYEQP